MTDSPGARWPARQPARLPSPPRDAHAEPIGFTGVRLSIGQADAALKAAADRLAPPRAFLAREPFNILALSGGAAGGAFGAGVLIGLTEAGQRPDFAIVTGVSTGALIAPFAFLGPDFDSALASAFTGGAAAKLLTLARLATGFGPGVFRAAPLDELIRPFVTRQLLDAIAAQHARGRRLLVATTNLDKQQTSIWDMGAIAAHPGSAPVRLFLEVLVASASLPGIFAPKLIDVDVDGVRYQELHVDGGASSPLFVMPEALLHWRALGRHVRGGRVYVIVNTVLDGDARTVPPRFMPVLVRSVDTVLRFSYRQALSVTAAFCDRHGLPLSIASIPSSFSDANLLRFESATMRRMFDEGLALARSGEIWRSSVATPADWSDMAQWPSLLSGPLRRRPKAGRSLQS
jgi:hypothetical protein